MHIHLIIYSFVLICFIGFGAIKIVDFKYQESKLKDQPRLAKIYLEDEDKLVEALEQKNFYITRDIEFNKDISWRVDILPNGNYQEQPDFDVRLNMIYLELSESNVWDSIGSLTISGLPGSSEPLQQYRCDMTFKFDNGRTYEFLDQDCNNSFYLSSTDSENLIVEDMLKSKKLSLTIFSNETGEINMDYDLEKLWWPCLTSELCNSNSDTEFAVHSTSGHFINL